MGGMSVFMLRLGRSAVTECVQSSPGAAVVSTPPALGWSDFITSVAGTTIVHNTDTTDSFFSQRGKDVQFPVLTKFGVVKRVDSRQGKTGELLNSTLCAIQCTDIVQRTIHSAVLWKISDWTERSRPDLDLDLGTARSEWRPRAVSRFIKQIPIWSVDSGISVPAKPLLCPDTEPLDPAAIKGQVWVETLQHDPFTEVLMNPIKLG